MVIGEFLPALREAHSAYHYLPRRGNLFRITCNGWILLRKFVSHHAANTSKALNSKGVGEHGYNSGWNAICSPNRRPGWRKRQTRGELKRPLPRKGACRFESGPRTLPEGWP